MRVSVCAECGVVRARCRSARGCAVGSFSENNFICQKRLTVQLHGKLLLMPCPQQIWPSMLAAHWVTTNGGGGLGEGGGDGGLGEGGGDGGGYCVHVPHCLLKM